MERSNEFNCFQVAITIRNIVITTFGGDTAIFLACYLFEWCRHTCGSDFWIGECIEVDTECHRHMFMPSERWNSCTQFMCAPESFQFPPKLSVVFDSTVLPVIQTCPYDDPQPKLYTWNRNETQKKRTYVLGTPNNNCNMCLVLRNTSMAIGKQAACEWRRMVLGPHI